MVEHPAWYLWDLGQAAQLPQDPPGSSGTTQDPHSRTAPAPPVPVALP